MLVLSLLLYPTPTSESNQAVSLQGHSNFTMMALFFYDMAVSSAFVLRLLSSVPVDKKVLLFYIFNCQLFDDIFECEGEQEPGLNQITLP